MRHPLAAAGRRNIAVGVAILAFGIGAYLLFGGPHGGLLGDAMAIASALFGGFLVWNGRSLYTSAIAAATLERSAALVSRGRLEEADAVLAEVPAKAAEKRTVRRVLTMQRALIALTRGDAKTAEAEASASLLVPGSAFMRDWDEVQKAEAHGMRALARAALGKRAAVEEDARAIAASAHAHATAIARVELARAALLARAGEKAALADHLARHGSTILEHVLPRERSLTRALRAFARAPGKSVYREPARPVEEEEARVRTWIGAIAPDAAAHAPRERATIDAALPVPQADPKARSAIATARRAARGSSKLPAGVLAISLVGGALAALSQTFLSSRDADPGPNDELLVGAAFVAVFTLTVVVTMRVVLARFQKEQLRVITAARTIAQGDAERGRHELVAVASGGRFPILSASAQLQLAILSNKQGDFAGALAEADAGLGLCQRNVTTRRVASDLVLPGLIAEHALALAALARFAEAETELAELVATFPRYRHLDRALFRVRLVSAVRQGDLATAARIARTRTPELPLDLQVDLLADVALAASGEPIAADERDRIATELRAMPEVAAWIEALSAGLSTRVAMPIRLAGEGDDRGAEAQLRFADPDADPDEQGARGHVELREPSNSRLS